MACCSDAAAVRECSFDVGHGQVKAWIDADDILPEPEEAIRLLQKNERLKPPAPPDGKGIVDLREKAFEGVEKNPTLIEMIQFIAKAQPEVEAIWCPYLYKQGPEGEALVWQDRERLILKPGEWEWTEAAPEVRVP